MRLPIKPEPTPIQPRISLPALPNASVGQPYDAPFAHADLLEVSLPGDCGLHWQNGQLRGTPAHSGDLALSLTLRHPQGGTFSASHMLHVNPDPKSLWKNLPSDAHDPFWKADDAQETRTSAHGMLLAARVRGRSHAHVGSFCDDDYRLAVHEATHTHILVVADGAGSASHARLGSQLAVNAVTDTLLALLDNGAQHGTLPHAGDDQQRSIVENLFDHAVYQALQAHDNAVAAHNGIAGSKALATTLLIALTLPLDTGQWLTAAYWIGDGAIAVQDEHGFHLLGNADSGTYSGETQFLHPALRSGEALHQRTRVHHSARAPLLMIMTDGVSDAKFASDASLGKAECWQTLLDELQTPLHAADPAQALGEWLQFWSPGNHDDRTLALFIPGKSA